MIPTNQNYRQDMEVDYIQWLDSETLEFITLPNNGPVEFHVVIDSVVSTNTVCLN